MNSTENIREGPCVIDPFKVRLNQKLKIDVNFLFFFNFFIRKNTKERETFTSFADSRQAIGGGGIRNLPPPSPSPSFQSYFTVWRLKCRYGYITRSNMLQYEV